MLGVALSKTHPFLWFQRVQSPRVIKELNPFLAIPCNCSQHYSINLLYIHLSCYTETFGKRKIIGV
jgi:hypothetical protein